MKKQKGFAHLEALLILIIVGLIAFTGYFVWHAKSQATKNLSDAVNSSKGLPSYSAKKKSSTPTKKSAAQPSLVNYTATSAAGVEVSSEADVDKLDGASDSFKDFIKDKIKKNGNSPSPCGNKYGLFVKRIYKDEFALGGEGQCGGAEKLWAKISSQWSEIGATQQGFDCSLLEQYKVPSAIVEHCMKNGEEVNNTQG